jgi:hypothetical protein
MKDNIFGHETSSVRAKLVHVLEDGKKAEVNCMFNQSEHLVYNAKVEQFKTDDLAIPVIEEYILLSDGRTYKGHFEIEF